MSQSLAKVLVHAIFSTKHRQPLIGNDVEAELHAYMAGILKGLDSPAIIAGGTADHVHILFLLYKNRPLTEVMEEVKRGSSKWIKTKGNAYSEFYWQAGYGAFSIGESGVPSLRDYIARQKEHHRRLTFQDELRILFGKYGIAYDEKYVWD